MQEAIKDPELPTQAKEEMMAMPAKWEAKSKEMGQSLNAHLQEELRTVSGTGLHCMIMVHCVVHCVVQRLVAVSSHRCIRCDNHLRCEMVRR